MTAEELDREVMRELRSLSAETQDKVARHLVAAGQLLDEDPAAALAQARAARASAGRIAVVREAVGVAAYLAGEWAEALAELRAVRRMTGSVDHIPVMADCERALGRPDRALALAADPEAKRLAEEGLVELSIVVSGARRDLGQGDAAVVALQGAALSATAVEAWTPRLWYAYAEALLAAGRREEAEEWFASVVGVDDEEQTDAAERLSQLQRG